MQEQNNFERQVKETMDGFSIQPSAPVWQKIEKEIRQKKERRRFALWVAPLLVAGGLWLALAGNYDGEQNTTAKSANTPVTIEQNQPSNRPLSPGEMSGEEGIQKPGIANDATSTKPDTSNNIPEVTGQDPAHPALSVTTKNRLTQKVYQRSRAKKAALVGDHIPSSALQAKKETPSVKTDLTEKKSFNPLEANNNKQETNDKAQEIDTKVKEANITTPVVESNEKTLESTPVMSVDSGSLLPDTEAVEPASRARKWKISLQATGGYAQTMNSFFPVAASPESNIAPNSVGFSPRVSPGEPTPGTSFSAGPIFSTTVSTKLKFNTGIQYTYASTKQPYGEMAYGNWYGVSPTADSGMVLLKTGRSNRYTNRYHFIEIPAGISYRPFTTIPVDLHTGISLAGLITSNAVEFDEAYDLYYTQKNNLRRIGLNAFAGFSYSLAKERLKIGPHMQYSLLPVHAKDIKRYMFTGGVRAALSLN